MPCFSNIDYPSSGNNLTVKYIQTSQRKQPQDCATFFPPTFSQQRDTVDPQIVQQYMRSVRSSTMLGMPMMPPRWPRASRRTRFIVTNTGPIYGREAIEKMYANLFKQIHFSNCTNKRDRYSPHVIGAAGNEIWGAGEWSNTIQGKDFGPLDQKGYWGAITVLEDGVLKDRMQTWNITPGRAATPSPSSR
jgi:hypothetical protein